MCCVAASLQYERAWALGSSFLTLRPRLRLGWRGILLYPLRRLARSPTDLVTPFDRMLGLGDPCLPRKEVIQPHLPVQLPCYDLVPVTSPTLGACLLAVSPATSSVADFHDLTGGVYKTRERIHRSVLTCGY